MSVIAIINRKGGSGKSTLATHLAVGLVRAGHRVMLGDVDRQQSTVPWLKRRQGLNLDSEALVGWAMDPQRVLRPPAGVRHVVLDTPGGLHGLELNRVLGYADVVVVPVCDALFDRESAAACLADLRGHPRVVRGQVQLAVVGMRVDTRVRGAEQRLADWAASQGVPWLGALRYARVYAHCAERGLTVFDLPEQQAAVDAAQWPPVMDWLAQTLERSEALAHVRKRLGPSASGSVDAAGPGGVGASGAASGPAGVGSTLAAHGPGPFIGPPLPPSAARSANRAAMVLPRATTTTIAANTAAASTVRERPAAREGWRQWFGWMLPQRDRPSARQL